MLLGILAVECPVVQGLAGQERLGWGWGEGRPLGMLGRRASFSGRGTLLNGWSWGPRGRKSHGHLPNGTLGMLRERRPESGKGLGSLRWAGRWAPHWDRSVFQEREDELRAMARKIRMKERERREKEREEWERQYSRQSRSPSPRYSREYSSSRRRSRSRSRSPHYRH